MVCYGKLVIRLIAHIAGHDDAQLLAQGKSHPHALEYFTAFHSVFLPYNQKHPARALL